MLTTVLVYLTAVDYAVAIGLWVPPALVYVTAVFMLRFSGRLAACIIGQQGL